MLILVVNNIKLTNSTNCVIHTCIGEEICNKICLSAIYVYINDDDLVVKDRTRILFSLTYINFSTFLFVTINAGIGLPGIALILSPIISRLKRSVLDFINNPIFNFPATSRQARLPEDNAQLKTFKI